MDEAAVKALIAEHEKEVQHFGSDYAHAFQQITDNIKYLNAKLQEEVNTLIDARESAGLKRGDTVELK